MFFSARADTIIESQHFYKISMHNRDVTRTYDTFVNKIMKMW